jgi:hypothetical protein
MIATGFLGTLGGEIIVVVAIVVLLWIIYKIGKSLLKIILGIVINSVLGIGSIYLVDLIFNMGIPFQAATLIPLALFGLPAAGTLIILKFFAVTL